MQLFCTNSLDKMKQLILLFYYYLFAVNVPIAI